MKILGNVDNLPHYSASSRPVIKELEERGIEVRKDNEAPDSDIFYTTNHQLVASWGKENRGNAIWAMHSVDPAKWLEVPMVWMPKFSECITETLANVVSGHAYLDTWPEWNTVALGYPKLDAAVAAWMESKPADGLTVLYTPSWQSGADVGYGRMDLWGPSILNLSAEMDFRLLFKPHPSGSSPFLNRLLKKGSENKNLTMIDRKADASSFFSQADILISDTSSTIFEFASFDKPVIQATDGRHGRIDFGPSVRDENGLEEAIIEAAESPDTYSKQRRDMKMDMFTNWGNATMPVADYIEGFLE